MSLASSEHYTSRALALEAALRHLALPPLERRSDTAIELALEATPEEGLDFVDGLQELLGEFAVHLRDLAQVAPSEMTPRERHDTLLRRAEKVALAGELDKAARLADLARIWAQAIIAFPPAPQADKS